MRKCIGSAPHSLRRCPSTGRCALYLWHALTRRWARPLRWPRSGRFGGRRPWGTCEGGFVLLRLVTVRHHMRRASVMMCRRVIHWFCNRLAACKAVCGVCQCRVQHLCDPWAACKCAVQGAHVRPRLRVREPWRAYAWAVGASSTSRLSRVLVLSVPQLGDTLHGPSLLCRKSVAGASLVPCFMTRPAVVSMSPKK